MNKYFLAAFMVIFLSGSVLADQTKIYVWRNTQGELVFSDTPKPGAKEVQHAPENVIKVTKSIDSTLLDTEKQVISDNYDVKIKLPKDNATIRDNTGSVFVSGTVQPIFKSGLKIQLLLDGKNYNKPQSHTMFSLKNVDRGEHQLQLKLISEKGKVIALSKPITFYMHRASVN
ncbi:MAG: DUF4124 domain-containing protein [Colwellia sp.]